MFVNLIHRLHAKEAAHGNDCTLHFPYSRKMEKAEWDVAICTHAFKAASIVKIDAKLMHCLKVKSREINIRQCLSPCFLLHTLNAYCHANYAVRIKLFVHYVRVEVSDARM